MVLSKRGDEVARIVEILEQDHESADKAGLAVLRVAAEILSHREAWVAVCDVVGGPLMFGPWWSERDAVKAAERLPGYRGVARLYPASELEKDIDGGGVDSACQECGHPDIAHIDRQWFRWRSDKPSEPGCMVPGCECRYTGLVRKVTKYKGGK